MNFPDHLQTDRLQLRRLRVADAPVIRALSGIWEIAGMTAGVPFPYPAGAAEDFIAFDARQREAKQSSTFAMTLDGALIGLMGLDRRVDEDTGAVQWELGYWLGMPWWRQGYTTEAGRRVLQHAADDLGLAVIHSSCFEDNPASHHVLEKLGFREESRGLAPSRARQSDVPTIFLSLPLARRTDPVPLSSA